MTAAFLSLLRAGLWSSAVDAPALFPLSADEWEAVYGMARRQAVRGIVWHGICQLPDNMMPQETLLLRWVAEVERIERANRRMAAMQEEILQLFRQNGLSPFVQKGLSVAQYYDTPLLRECGDIDLYFADRRESQEAVALVGQHGVKVTTRPDDSFCYSWQGIIVEHHHSLTDIANPLRQSDVKTKEQKDGVTSELVLLMLNAHILKHALGRGIGLRQLCDIARAYHSLRCQISSADYRSLVRKLGLAKWTRMLHSFVTLHLGLQETCLPYQDERVDSTALLNKVLASGNFGQSLSVAEGNMTALQRKSRTAAAFVRNLSFSLRYAPVEAFWHFVNLAVGQKNNKEG